jgi:hypothetical protein
MSGGGGFAGESVEPPLGELSKLSNGGPYTATMMGRRKLLAPELTTTKPHYGRSRAAVRKLTLAHPKPINYQS